MNINAKNSPVSFFKFLYATAVIFLVFALFTGGMLFLFHVMEVKYIFFILMIILILPIPLVAGLGWLFAKGSNWTYSQLPILLAFYYSGSVSALLLGGLIGSHFFKIYGIVFGLILNYLVLYLLHRYGKSWAEKFTPYLINQK